LAVIRLRIAALVCVAGHSGEVVNYIARTKAVKRLQISLKDFRRLCILKGIYPREPKNKKVGNTQTYYHIKDISYLTHEPLLAKFREFKVRWHRFVCTPVRFTAGRAAAVPAARCKGLRSPSFLQTAAICSVRGRACTGQLSCACVSTSQ